MYKDGIEVIYFAYKPDERFFDSLSRISKQSEKPAKVSIYLTIDEFFEKDAFEKRVSGLCTDIKSIGFKYINKKDFSHGGTRQLAMEGSEYEYVLLMTMDAVPYDNLLTEKLITALDRQDSACAYARQVAYPQAGTVEKLYRAFNYPKKSRSKTASDFEKLGVKAIFNSDVCCMYRHSVFDKTGGFNRSLNFGEDSIYAYNVMMKGYSVEYCAEAIVFHSHDDSFSEKFRRSRQIAVSQSKFPEIYRNLKSENEGIRFFVRSLKYLGRKHDLKAVFDLVFTCAAKYLGYFTGKHFG